MLGRVGVTIGKSWKGWVTSRGKRWVVLSGIMWITPCPICFVPEIDKQWRGEEFGGDPLWGVCLGIQARDATCNTWSNSQAKAHRNLSWDSGESAGKKKGALLTLLWRYGLIWNPICSPRWCRLPRVMKRGLQCFKLVPINYFRGLCSLKRRNFIFLPDSKISKIFIFEKIRKLYNYLIFLTIKTGLKNTAIFLFIFLLSAVF